MFFKLHDQEAYDTIHAVLPSFEEREIVRQSRPFKDFLQFWCDGNYNASNKVGYLMAAAGKLTADSTHDDWEMLYYKECKTPSQVLIQIEVMMANADIDFKTAVTYWWIHIQDGPFGGTVNEKKIFAKVEVYAHSKGYKVRVATPHEDKNLGVDFVVYDPNDNDRTIVGGQTKPLSHFSNHPAVVRSREVYDKPKYAKFTAQYGAPVWYVIIETTLKTGVIDWRKV